jgi:hypothetical protein
LNPELTAVLLLLFWGRCVHAGDAFLCLWVAAAAVMISELLVPHLQDLRTVMMFER